MEKNYLIIKKVWMSFSVTCLEEWCVHLCSGVVIGIHYSESIQATTFYFWSFMHYLKTVRLTGDWVFSVWPQPIVFEVFDSNSVIGVPRKVRLVGPHCLLRRVQLTWQSDLPTATHALPIMLSESSLRFVTKRSKLIYENTYYGRRYSNL